MLKYNCINMTGSVYKENHYKDRTNKIETGENAAISEWPFSYPVNNPYQMYKNDYYLETAKNTPVTLSWLVNSYAKNPKGFKDRAKELIERISKNGDTYYDNYIKPEIQKKKYKQILKNGS